MIHRRRVIQLEVAYEETSREERRSNEETFVATKTHGGLCTNITLQMESLYTFKSSLSCFILTKTGHKLMTNLAGTSFTPHHA